MQNDSFFNKLIEGLGVRAKIGCKKNGFSNMSGHLHYLYILLILCIILFGLNIWGYPLIDVDEPRYMETAREMLFKPGDWITPHFNYLIRFDKPPLYYWLIVSGFKLFGVHEWVGRAISGLAATGIVVGCYLAVRKLLSEKPAFIAGLIIATMAEIFLIGRWAVTDMTLTFWMCSTTLLLFIGLRQNAKAFLWAGIAAGFGMLTKGPIALLLPGVIAVLYTVLFERQNWRWLISKYLIGGIVLSIIIALPWYMACHMANPETFIPAFFGLHNITRFTQTVSGHTGGWGYYVPVILIGAFPWTLCFAPLLLHLKHYLQQTHEQGAAGKALFQYSLIWFITVVIFFTLAQTKLLTYILLCFPALGITCALLFDYVQQQEIDNKLSTENKRIMRLTVLSVFLPYLFILSVLFIFLSYQQLYPAVADVLQYCNIPLLSFGLMVLLLIGLLTIGLNHYKGSKWLFNGLLTQAVILYLIVATQVLPAIAHERQADLVTLVKKARADHAILATWQSKRPSLVFYSEQKVYYLQLDCFHSKEDEVDDIASPPQNTIRFLSKPLPKPDLSIYKPDRPIYLVLKTRSVDNLKALLKKQQIAPQAILAQGPHISLMLLDKLPKKACLRKDINQ